MRLFSLMPLFASCVVLIGSMACVTVSHFDADPDPTPQPPDRTDCAEVYNSAFRSETEREWFTTNCSVWGSSTLGVVETPRRQPAPPPAPVAPPTPVPPTEAPVPPPAPQAEAPPPQPGENPRCAQMRGQPYANAADQTWFLTNCLGATIQQVPGDSPECARIRGRPYESDQQRAWFLANCSGNAQPTFDSGPDRFNCEEIRGTRYRSVNERNWYLQNCPVSP